MNDEYKHHTPPQIYANVMAAIDWLEANPDRHLRRNWATTIHGASISPISPNAHCFCVLGRIAHEANIDTSVNALGTMAGYLEGVGMSAGRMMDVNDHGHIGPVFQGRGIFQRLVNRKHNFLRSNAEADYRLYKERHGSA